MIFCKISKCKTLCICSLPNYFVSVVLCPKDHIQQHLEVVARSGVAVQVKAAGRLEHAAQLHQARCHHGQVRHHVAAAQDEVKSAQGICHRSAFLHLFFVSTHGIFIPLPSVFEGLDLRAGLAAVFLREEHVIGGVGIEGRVEVDQVHTLVLDVAPQDIEVIAVVEGVHLDLLYSFIIKYWSKWHWQ